MMQCSLMHSLYCVCLARVNVPRYLIHAARCKASDTDAGDLESLIFLTRCRDTCKGSAGMLRTPSLLAHACHLLKVYLHFLAVDGAKDCFSTAGSCHTSCFISSVGAPDALAPIDSDHTSTTEHTLPVATNVDHAEPIANGLHRLP